MRLETRFSDIGDNPVTLQTAKAFLRIGNNVEDALITGMITSATEWCEKYLGRTLRDMTVEALFTDVGTQREFELPFGPVDTIDEVATVYGDGTETALTASQYEVLGLNTKYVNVPYIFTTKTLAGYKFTYTTLADCPTIIKDVILDVVSEMWSTRGVTVEGSVQEVKMLSIYKLLDMYRVKTWF